MHGLRLCDYIGVLLEVESWTKPLMMPSMNSLDRHGHSQPHGALSERRGGGGGVALCDQ